MDINELRAQAFQIAGMIYEEYQRQAQSQPGFKQQVGPLSGLIEKLAPIMQQHKTDGQSFMGDARPSQPVPAEGTAMAAWLRGNCRFASASNTISCPDCGTTIYLAPKALDHMGEPMNNEPKATTEDKGQWTK